MEAYKRVAAARAKGRPTGSDFIEHITEISKCVLFVSQVNSFTF